MKLLLIPAVYPYPGAEWIGPQNERCALALRSNLDGLEVLTPRPYAPRVLGFAARWRAFSKMPFQDTRQGIRVHRPAYPVLPRVFQAFWPTTASFLFSRRLALALHRDIEFDAILSFDLVSTGGLAWRLGRYLGIPACGWATGGDIRWSASTPIGRRLRETLENLDLVFYQSEELRILGAHLLGMPPEKLPSARHVVQSRGVVEPVALPDGRSRRAIRSKLQLPDDRIIVLYLGRIVRDKGLFDLVEGFTDWTKDRKDLALLLVGADYAHDDASELQNLIRTIPGIDGHIKVLPACNHDQIWDYFKAADIFAFPSFREGMPNSLLEAMLGGLPAIAFSIPAIQEITRFGKGLIEVDAYDFSAFGKALLRLAADSSLRLDIAARGHSIVREHFGLHRNMRNVVDHIERIIPQ